MKIISIKLDEDDVRLFEEYATSKGINLSSLIRNTLLEIIETDKDLELHEEALRNHRENPGEVSFEEFQRQLNINEGD